MKDLQLSGSKQYTVGEAAAMDIYEKISTLSQKMEEESVRIRRDLHKHPETAFLEMRTTVIIEKHLKELGYEVLTGKAVCKEGERLGVPSPEELSLHASEVLGQGISEEDLTEEIREGYTGVIGILRCGEGPVTALRFDIDALGMNEASDMEHRPFREGFSSVNRGMMHGCGHDGHAAIGLGVAKLLMEIKEELRGTVKLIFQPGEEGGHGAVPIVAKGHLDDVDYFIGNHIAPTNSLDDGDVTPGTYGSLANTKYDVWFRGEASHAGGYPEKGRNALVSASHAVLGLYSIPRHSQGQTRVNVGTLHAGTGRNVIPDTAKLEIEVRGEDTEINDYMSGQAESICKGAAMMTGCSCEMKMVGRGETQHSDEELWGRIGNMLAEHCPDLRVSSIPNARNWGSEDISVMMNRVQSHGGLAAYMRTMTDMASPQHTVRFDFDEKVLVNGIRVFASIVYDLNGRQYENTYIQRHDTDHG
ncbi:amidohydrolase [Oribacterium sp. P6A1]|uniref:amidohydrolase n=1 Tax=Oribacterium sp. P6A1 TaxID=1410612 RepID=UPI000AB0A19D|nr:amidohydrolase [Oribacterium sp. P6A1]